MKTDFNTAQPEKDNETQKAADKDWTDSLEIGWLFIYSLYGKKENFSLLVRQTCRLLPASIDCLFCF
jgi:hypothetical protein